VKVALLINRENFEKYAHWNDVNWELVHMGNSAPDPEKVIATGAGALVVDAIMKVGPEVIENMPGLKLVHSQGVGFNGINLDSAKKSGVYVCNNAGVNAKAVAEHVILLILALLKRFRHNEDMIYADRQMEAKMACFKDALPELFGQRVGIVGYGAIGKALAVLLKAFGCDVCYYTPSGDCGEDGVTYMPLEELYTKSDIISLNAPVTPETENMINAKTLALMKRGAILINSARGELMDHDAVAAALISGQLGGLGADTLAPEPFLLDSPLIKGLPEDVRQRVALAPHIAGISAGMFKRVYEHVRKNIDAIERGEKPDCIVNGL